MLRFSQKSATRISRKSDTSHKSAKTFFFLAVMEITGRKWRTFVGIGYQAFFSLGYMILGGVAYRWRNWHEISVIRLPTFDITFKSANEIIQTVTYHLISQFNLSASDLSQEAVYMSGAQVTCLFYSLLLLGPTLNKISYISSINLNR